MCIPGSLTGDETSEREADHSNPSLVEVKAVQKFSTSSPHTPSWCAQEQLYLLPSFLAGNVIIT
jgi:hypothetical protein